MFASNSKWHWHIHVKTHQHVCVTTLALGLRPRQGLARVRAKKEAQESHLMLQGVWESVKE
jgi:hypothetical protein